MTSELFKSLLFFSALGAAIGLLVRLLLPRVLAWRGVWFTWHTKFGPALVFDSKDADGTTVRLLNVGGTFQSICYVDDDLLWDPVCEYHRSWAQAVHLVWPKAHGGSRAAHEEARRALVMGGGGFSFPKWLVAYRQDFSCVTVEIDEAIVQIAEDQFFLDRLESAFHTKENGRLRLVVDDAWAYLANSNDSFDLIINDAFRGNKPMGRVNTFDGAMMIRDHLTSGGIYIGNARTPLEGKKSLPLWNAADTFLAVFGNVWVIPERPEDPKKPGNNALIACEKELDLGTISGAVQYLNPGKGVNTWQTIS